MQRALRTKIKSNKGASVSMALLLFLVCAVIGAVVLTAATASAGRFSDLAEMDQRYYSVSSATELLISQLCDKTITIKETVTKTVKKTTKYIIDVNGDISEDTNDPIGGTEDPIGGKEEISTEYQIGSDVYDDSSVITSIDDMPFLTQRATEIFLNEGSASGSFKLQHTAKSLDSDVDWTLDTDGKLNLIIKSGSDGKAYKLKLVLIPYVSEEKNTSSTNSEPTVTTIPNGYKREITTTIVENRVSTIKWTFGEIVKEVSQPNEDTTSNG